MTSHTPTANIKTRILILSDTHGLVPGGADDAELRYGLHDGTFSSFTTNSSSSNARFAPASTSRLTLTSAFRYPLPSADVAIHCGDLTKGSSPAEYAATLSLLASLDAPLKIAIPGNHDMALDPRYWADRYPAWEEQPGAGTGTGTGTQLDRRRTTYPAVVRGMVAEARRLRGVELLVEEGTYDFVLGSGARLRVYASPWTPEYGGWAFQFRGRHEFQIEAGMDVVVTHGPPKGVLDRTLYGGEEAGCADLMEAVRRARPSVHCFGHIHEAWGARARRWPDGKEVVIDDLETLEGTGQDSLREKEWKVARRNEWAEKRARLIDLSQTGGYGGYDGHRGPLSEGFVPGRDTLFVNAAILDIRYQPRHMPWLVDLDLPKADEVDAVRASHTAVRIEEDYRMAETAAASLAGGLAPPKR